MGPLGTAQGEEVLSVRDSRAACWTTTCVSGESCWYIIHMCKWMFLWPASTTHTKTHTAWPFHYVSPSLDKSTSLRDLFPFANDLCKCADCESEREKRGLCLIAVKQVPGERDVNEGQLGWEKLLISSVEFCMKSCLDVSGDGFHC